MTVRDSPFSKERRRGGGGGGGGGGRDVSEPAPPSVRFGKPGEVFIGGQGYSVSPEKAATLIQQHGGVITPQIQKQITQRIVQQQQLQQQQQQLQQQRKLEQAIASQTKTRTDLAPPPPDITVHPPGTIYQVQTDKYKGTPIVKTYTVGEDYSSREATASERKQLEEYRKAEIYEDVALKDSPSEVSKWFGEEKGKISKLMSEEVVNRERLQTTFGGGQIGEDISNLIYGSVGTKGALLQTGIITGVSAGAGFAIKGVTAGATYGATRLFGATAGRVTGTTLKTGVIGGGLYLGGTYVSGQTTKLYYAPTRAEKFQIAGRTATDITAGLYGFKMGAKGWDIFRGELKTREMKDITRVATDPFVESGERRFVEISKTEYKTLSQSQRQQKYKKIFEDNKALQEALGVKKGGIHVTTEKGDYSELTRALHIAPKASTRFLGLGGKGESTRYIPSLKELFSAPKEPQLIWVEAPKGFGKVKGYEYKRGFYKWEKPLTSGEKAYITGAKPEIEAVFYQSVTKGLKPISYKGSYIKTHGVKVPFTGAYKAVSIKGKKDLIPKGKIVDVIPISSPYKPPALLKPSAGVVSYRKPPKSYTPTSYSSVMSSISSSAPSLVSSPKISKGYSPTSLSKVMPSSSSIISSPTPPPPSYPKPSRRLPTPPPSSRPYYYKQKPPYTPSLLPQQKPFGFYLKGTKLKLPKQKRIQIFGRRFGKWKSIGFARTPRQAIFRGREWAERTLGVSFKIGGKLKSQKLYGFRTKKTPKGLIYIEKRRRRLKKRGVSKEVPEIQFYKGLKTSTKKKKKKGGKK